MAHGAVVAILAALVGNLDDPPHKNATSEHCISYRPRLFVQEWERPGEALAIMQPSIVAKLKARHLPMEVLHKDPRRILVRKP